MWIFLRDAYSESLSSCWTLTPFAMMLPGLLQQRRPARPGGGKTMSYASLLAGFVRQAPDIGCKHMHLVLAEEVAEARHAILATVVDGLHDHCLAGTPQPDLVGQVRRAHCVITRSVSAMTGRALGRKDIHPALRAHRAVGQVGHRAH